MSLMEMFSNPDTIESLSTGEKLLGGLVTTGMGLGTTFVVLLLLWVIIAVVSKVITGMENKGKKSQAQKSEAPVAVVATETSVSNAADEGELIAVITAAIAAIEGSAAMSKLNVKRISRITGNANAWSAAGRSECIDSRR